MLFKKKKTKLEQILEQFENTPQEHSLALNQNFMPQLLNDLYVHYGDKLPEYLEGLKKMPFPDAWNIVQRAVTTGMVEGAKAFAFVTRQPGLASDHVLQIPPGQLNECFYATYDEDTLDYQAFHAAINLDETFDFLLHASVMRIVEGITEEFPGLASEKGELHGFAMAVVLDGVRAEFATVRMMPQVENLVWFMEKMHTKINEESAGADGEPQSNHAGFKQVLDYLEVGLPPGTYPWPQDLRCLCQADLRPFIFCCEAENTIDPELLAEFIGPEFLFRCDDCSNEVEGFMCDQCGRTYSWQKGIVPSLHGLQ